MAIKFVKEVPAQVKTSKGRNSRIVAQLEANPNEWAVAYRTQKRSTAQSRAYALKNLGAEVTTRTEGSRIVIYARVVGKVKVTKVRPKKRVVRREPKVLAARPTDSIGSSY
jgi:hypothetical protein